VVAVYGAIIGHHFLLNWDDPVYITENPTIQGITLENLKTAFTSLYAGNYAPLHIVSYMLDYALWGMNPAGFFATNLILHFLNGALFYFLLLRLRITSTTSVFVSAAFFLFHPVQVESVAWASQRKNLLSMLFLLASFYMYTLYKDRLNNRKRPYFFSIAFFAAALLTKVVTVILLPVLLLYDHCFVSQQGGKKNLVEKIPYLAVAVVAGIAAVITQSPENGGGRTEYFDGSLIVTLLTMLPVLVRYLLLLLWPQPLSEVYEVSVKHQVDGDVAFAAIVAIILIYIGVALYRKNKRIFFWYAFFFIALLPVSQIVPIVTFMNDRYLYFPLLGAAALFGYLVSHLAGKVSRPGYITAAALLVIILLGIGARERTQVWESSLNLWKDTVAKAPNSDLPLFCLGESYRYEGDSEAALRCYENVLKISPRHRDALYRISMIYLKRKNFQAAQAYLLRLVAVQPNGAKAYVMLAINSYVLGYSETEKWARDRALKLLAQRGEP